MRPASDTRCPGCGLAASDGGGAPPAEHVASAACFTLYGEVLARGYGDAAYRPVHQMVVDAYAAQHAGGSGHREVQQVALCLMTLGLFIEEAVDPADGPRLHKLMMARRPDLHRLEPPATRWSLTIADVHAARDADEHQDVVRRWASEVWGAWAPHHEVIRRWNAESLGVS